MTQLRTRRHGQWQWPLALLTILVMVALVAPWIAPHSPDVQRNYDILANQAPSATYPFGTDPYGRDVLSRVLYGARVSLSLAFAAVALALLLGTTYGATAGLLGGAVDRWLMRALDVALSLPRLLLLLAITAFWPHVSLVALIVLLGTTGWFDVARLVRGEVQALAERDFLVAARATGVPRRRVLWRHVLPHLVPLLVVSASLNVASTIALEAGLSYLGLGVQDPTPSWGTILRDGSGVLDSHWWLTLFPGLATILAIMACHALGDALRDLFAMDQVPA